METTEILQPSPWEPSSPCTSERQTPWPRRGVRRVGPFRVAQTDEGVAVRNDLVGIAFGPEQTGAGLDRLRHFPTRTDFLTPSNKLWEIHVRRADGVTVGISNEGRRAHVRVLGKDPLTVRLEWPAVAHPEVHGELNVVVTAALRTESAEVRLRITVLCRMPGAALWRVDFPVIGVPRHPEGADFAYSSLNHGRLYRKCRTRIQREHPSGFWSMQYVSLTSGATTLYVGCEDSRSSYKGFLYDPEAGLRTFVFPPDPEGWQRSDGRVETAYVQSFDIVLEPMQGDWYDAARRYRSWALKQRWASRGRVSHRRDTPSAFRSIALWMLESGAASDVVPRVQRAREFFRVPLGVHWYNWHEIPFDHEYPHYFPAKPGFAEGVRELRDAGVFVMPYINGRLWDNTLADFAKALPFACKDVERKPYTEVYGSSAPLSPMCPTQEFWHSTVADIVRRLRDECGVNALYIDQIASAGPRLCFDQSHGHPLGGGHWWTDGYDEMMEKVRAITGKEVTLTTENNCEAYAHWFDAFLIWTERLPEMCPIYPAVYGDRILRFGSPAMPNDDDTAFAVKVGRDFLWGAQLGWMGSWLLEPAHAAKAEFLRRLVRLKAQPHVRKFLAHGDMLRAPAWVEPPPRVTCTWQMGGNKAAIVSTDALERAAWRASRGNEAVFVANFDDRAHSAVLDLRGCVQGGDVRRVDVPARDAVLLQ